MSKHFEGGNQPEKQTTSFVEADVEWNESPMDRAQRLQSMERMSGNMPDFGENLSVEVAMSKDKTKRPGDERGEDMYLMDPETGLTGVFDGLGGQGNPGSGAKASSMAAVMAPALYRQLAPKASISEMNSIAQDQAELEHPDQRLDFRKGLLAEWDKYDPAIKKEIVALYQTVKKLSEMVQKTEGMTTATLGKTVRTPDGRRFEVIANVGDSGAILIHADGSAEKMTREDSAIDGLISMGVLTPEQAADPDRKVGKTTVRDLRRMMYQALGNPDTDTPTIPRISVRELKPGDKAAYASDGVIDEIADENGEFDPQWMAEVINEGGTKRLLDVVASGVNKDGSKKAKPKRDECVALVKEALMDVELDNEEEVEIDVADIIEETP